MSFVAYCRRRQLIGHYADSYSTELTLVPSSKAHTKLKKKSGAAWISSATLLLTAVADMYVTNGTVLHRWYTHLFSTCVVANYIERLSSNSAWA